MLVKTNRIVVFLALALLVTTMPSHLEALTIARDGQSTAVVVVAADAPVSQQHAAAELAAFLKQITGARFPLVNQPTAKKTCLLVGPAAARFADRDFSVAALGPDGIVIRTVGNNLILAGPDPRGTLYAVYSFLEDQLGCRWWSEKVSSIPQRATVEIGPLDIRYVPPLEYRESFWRHAFDGDWSVRNKCNGSHCELDAKRGGKPYAGFVHTFYQLIPPDKYFADHPDWFSEIDGKRTHQRAQLCLANEEMRTELIKNLRQTLRDNPTATIASVSQNDWDGHCRCARCSAVDEQEGSPIGSVLRFVNAVAAGIEKEFPHVTISTLAYQYTRKPPRLVRPRPNVMIRLCTIECSFSEPLTHPRNQKFRDDIVGWSKIADRLFIWDYVTNFRHHILPHPNLRVLAPNIKFFVDHNVTGVFEQGAYTTKGAEMAELRAWVLAKLLWDPNLDGEKLIDEFLLAYYGPAAPHVRAYLNVTHDAVKASGDHLGCFSPNTAKFLSFEVLNRGWAHLQAAQKAVLHDPNLLARVEAAQLPVMYALMLRWNEMRDQAKQLKVKWPLPGSIETVFQQFQRVAKQKNITRLNEGQVGLGRLEKAVEEARKK